MTTPHQLTPGTEVLFTRQRHDAKRAGLHYDYRIVVGDKAYSWATKKELPEPGKAIVLFEQPVHDRTYALSERVEIPDGNYGAGSTVLEFVRKAKIGDHSTQDQLTIHSKGEKYLLKKLDPTKYGEKAWLFKNLGGVEKKAEMNRYLEKAAKAPPQGEKLQQQQVEALNKLDKNNGIIIHHSTGSGKTKTFLVAAQRALAQEPHKRALIVAPASLVSNVDKELKKHKIKLDRNRLDVLSYEKATNMSEELAKNKYSIAVADEAQKLRNPGTKRVKSLGDIIGSADKRLLATATANYNHAADIAPLINIAAGDKVLPEERKQFENRYIKTVTENPGFVGRLLGRQPKEYDTLKNTKELKKVFDEHVHYYDSREDPKAADKFPTVTEEAIEVNMSPEQQEMYRFMEGNIPYWTRMKIRHNMPMDKQEKAQLNSFSSGVRQVSNGHRHLVHGREVDYSPKIEKAVSELIKYHNADKNFRGLVYSNFLDAGVHEYSRKLKEKGIPHSVYTGKLTAVEKDKLVKDYNAGKTPVLVVSSSGAEGLDLRGTKLTQILEPHFNPSKIKQVKGRGARYESHTHLPKEEQTMHVQHYRTVYPKPAFGKAPYSIDKYLSENSDDKDAIFEKIKGLMKEND